MCLSDIYPLLRSDLRVVTYDLIFCFFISLSRRKQWPCELSFFPPSLPILALHYLFISSLFNAFLRHFLPFSRLQMMQLQLKEATHQRMSYFLCLGGGINRPKICAAINVLLCLILYPLRVGQECCIQTMTSLAYIMRWQIR